MKVFVDCGAYNGDTIEKAMQVHPDVGIYFGFEPYPANFKALAEKYKGDARVILDEAAVSTYDGWDKLYMYKDVNPAMDNLSVGNSVVPDKTNLIHDRFIEVRTVDLARWLRFWGDDEIILKLDIEGAEYSVLEHLIETGDIKRVKKIYCEWHLTKIPSISYERHQALIKKLNELGFPLTGGSRSDEFLFV